MKTTTTRSITIAVLAITLALSGVAGAFDAPTHPRTTRESVSSTGTPAVGTVLPGVISANGSYVVFTSTAANLVLTPNSGKQQVYVKDMLTGVVTCASVDASNVAGNDTSSAPALSGNGRVVAFVSQAANFSLVSTSHTGQLFVRDLETATTTLESVTTAGAPTLSRPASAPALSFDGRYLAFESQAQLEPRDRDIGTWDVFLRDRALHTTTLASLSANAIAGADSRAPSISADGRWVGFQSLDDTLVGGDVNHLVDVFLYDRTTEAVTLVSQNDAGQQTNAPSTSASVSSDGRFVLLMTSASNLVTSPTSTGSQLYVRDMRTNDAPVVTLGADESLLEGQRLSRVASFSDQDASISWSATVDYGDGSGR